MKIFFILLIFISSLFSHPHTFIDVYPTITTKNNSSSTIHFKWVMDDMTSTILIMELDQNGDGKISPKENRYIDKEYFAIFKDFDYYTHILAKGKKIKFPEATNFKASIENNKICYSFDIKLDQNIKDTVLEFGDSDFYVAMVLKKEFIDAKGFSSKVTGVDNDFYYGYRLELN
ncbi:MAG: DUF1007 family protein [Campylobacterota bacterium]|nr:DUF1007 family protein [Campylobacterota bacterium]